MQKPRSTRNRYKIIKEYSAKQINDFYDGYLENINLNLFKFSMIHPSEIILNNSDQRQWKLIAERDKFIDQWKDNQVLLAKDILKHGNYFPFWVYREDDGSIHISEGIHRLDSIHQAIELGIWTSQRIFCIEMDKRWDIETPVEPELPLPQHLEVNLPAYNIEYGWYEKIFNLQLSKFDNIDRLRALKEDGNFKITISSYDEYFNTCKVYHKLLRHALFKYMDTTGERIKARFPLG